MRPSWAVGVLAAFLALITFVPTGSAWILLGTDVAGDDTEGLTITPEPTGQVGGFVVPCPTADDCSDMDDVLKLEVATGVDTVDFKMTVQQRPEDSELAQGDFCWVAAFQVQGNEEEFLGMICQTYTNGEGADPAEAQDSSRGTEVASGFEWADGEAAIIIHVPLSSIGATVGTTLVDIYALTYFGGLYVDDPAPDAKSDRNAADSFGSFVIGSDLVLTGPSESETNTTSSSSSSTTSQSNTTTVASSSSTSSTSSSTSSTSSSAGSTSASSTASPSKDSPSAALPLLLVGVALAVAVRRRLP